jgi:hypothetical protein
MKKVDVLCAVVLVSLVPVFLFWGCAGDGDEKGDGDEDVCTKPAGTDYYYIRFILDGSEIDAQNIILNFGGDVNDPTLVWWPNLGWIEFEGFYCEGGKDASFPIFQLWIQMVPSTPGEFEGVYDGPDPPAIGGVSSCLNIWEDDLVYEYWVMTDGTLTITTFGDVGGDVEGSFDFTLETLEEDGAAPSFGTPLTAVGNFRVLRGSDDTFSPD